MLWYLTVMIVSLLYFWLSMLSFKNETFSGFCQRELRRKTLFWVEIRFSVHDEKSVMSLII